MSIIPSGAARSNLSANEYTTMTISHIEPRTYFIVFALDADLTGFVGPKPLCREAVYPW
jgi:hypothetical protein